MRRIRTIVLLTMAMLGLSACAPLPDDSTAADAGPPACVPAATNDRLTGNWLSVASQKGIAGSIRTLYTLRADGTMDYVQQVKRPRSPSQGLHETGCWSHADGVLELRTLQSNGLPVNLDDPIYVNRFRIERLEEEQLRMQGSSGTIDAKRMSPGYRLPF